MAIWLLRPRDLLHRVWKGSSYTGRAVVRAGSEFEARSIAAKAFKPLDGRVAFNPGIERDYVSVERMDQSSWREDGPAMIMEPEGYEPLML